MSSHFRFFLRCFEIKSECYSTVSSVHRHAIHRSTRKRTWKVSKLLNSWLSIGRSHKNLQTTWLRSRKLHLVHTRLGGFTCRLHCLWVHWSIMTWEVSHCISTFAILAFPWIVINGDIAKKTLESPETRVFFRWNERSHRLLVFSVKYFTLPSSPSCWICWMSMIHHFRTLEPATDRIYIFGLAACGLLRLKDYADYTSFAHVNSSSFLRRDSKTSCWSAIYRYL